MEFSQDWQVGRLAVALSRKLLGKYLTVFSHSYWLISSSPATLWTISLPWIRRLRCLYDCPATALVFMFPMTSQVEQISDVLLPRLFIWTFYINICIEFQEKNNVGRVKCLAVRSHVNHQQIIPVFTLTWWKYFKFKWENHHLLFVLEHFAK